jgi:hypothetical protein
MTPSAAASRTSQASTGSVRLRVGAGGAGRRRDAGAVLVHVAVAMMGLLAFSALTIDLGSLWVARAQAQNAADAGALAGGVALAYVNPTDTDAARAAAVAIVQQHQIWGEAVGPSSLETNAGACPPGAPSIPGACLQVRVSRGTVSGTPLPVFFSRLFGVNAADVAASASAKVMVGNAAPCVRPIALVDRWNDRYDRVAPGSGWTEEDLYEGYDASGNPNLPPGTGDAYDPPQASGPGTGITVADMAGVEITRTIFDPHSPLPIAGGSMLALDLPRPGSEGDPDVFRYEDNIASCSGVPIGIGSPATTFFPHRSFYTIRPIEQLIASDAGAVWDPTRRAVINSAFNVSPRIIIIPVINPETFSAQVRTGAAVVQAQVSNLVGFFLQDASESPAGEAQVRGVIVTTAGRFDAAAPQISDEAAFLRTVALVR